MTPTKDETVVLIRYQANKLHYITNEQNSLRLGYLRELATHLIELIDSMPEPERSNTTGMDEQ